MKTVFGVLVFLSFLHAAASSCDNAIAEVTTNCSLCSPHATCHLRDDLFMCYCDTGYFGSGLTCNTSSECAQKDCCPVGYKWDNSSACCATYNICSSLNQCSPLETCQDGGGIYFCAGPERNSTSLPNCSGETCSAGQDCINNSYSGPGCLDPCENYVNLSDPWRSVRYKAAGNDFHSDDDLHGWYRFVGEGGLQMLEGCVAKEQCGAAFPVTLGGKHPAPKDGIITLDGLVECTSETNISVKACPGNYYVYKFSGFHYFYRGYCTDPDSSCSPRCAPDEECRYSGGQWSCQCNTTMYPEPVLVSQLNAQLTCGVTEIKLSVNKCAAEAMLLNTTSAHLANESCKGITEVSGSQHLLSFITGVFYEDCGTQLSVNDTTVIYSNTLTLEPMTISSAVFSNGLAIGFLCSYPLDLTASLGMGVIPTFSVANLQVGGEGNYPTRMTLYQLSNYTSAYSGAVVTLSLDTILYVEILVENAQDDFALVMQNCFATPTPNISDTTRYDIIINGCPNPAGASVHVAQNGDAVQGRFSLKLFRFVSASGVYLHCQVKLCKTTVAVCKPSCSSQFSSRSGDTSDTATLSSVRIILDDYTAYGSSVSTGLPWTWKLCVLLIPLILHCM